MKLLSPERAAGGGAAVFSGETHWKTTPKNRNFLHPTPLFFHADFKSGS
jgi:hypothetical protein